MKIKKNQILFGLSVLFVAVLHFVISYLAAFAAGVGGSPTTKFIANVLTFPLSVLPPNSNLPLFPLWAVLSTMWGLAICYGIRRSGF
jgi:hypothetical protein